MLEQNPDAKLVVISSPTYEGVISNIKDIAEAAHKRNIPLLVDAAHGAHLGFSTHVRCKSVSEGADLVVMSLHKTMPALTGCALLHIRASLLRGFGVTCHEYLSDKQPSYILLALLTAA